MSGQKISVVETFLSIQGESTHAGRLCFFIRLAGCNLNCRYCDTTYAKKTSDGSEYEIKTLVELALNSGVKLVEVTGGEPLRQSKTPELCEKLLQANLEVLIETNGSLPISTLPAEVKKILDCKTPSSGMSEHNLYDNYRFLSLHDEVKFVISDRNDYDFSLDVIARYNLQQCTPNLLFSPGWNSITPETLAAWMIADKPPARLQLQMHKIIWGPDKTGV